MSRLWDASGVGLSGSRCGLLVSLSFFWLAFVSGLLLHSCRMAAAAPAITSSHGCFQSRVEVGRAGRRPFSSCAYASLFSGGRIAPSIHQQTSFIVSIGQKWPRLPMSLKERNQVGLD